MNAGLHGVLLLLAVILGAAGVWFGRRTLTQTPGRIRLIAAGALALMVIPHLLVFTPLWREHPPVQQIVIPYALSICAALLLRKRVAILLGVGFWALAWVLAIQYQCLLVSRRYTADESCERRSREAARETIRVLQRSLQPKAPEYAGRQFPSGPLPEELSRLVLAEHGQQLFDELEIRTTRALWHSWLTGLRQLEHRAPYLWSPGGSYADVVDGLEVRTAEE